MPLPISPAPRLLTPAECAQLEARGLVLAVGLVAEVSDGVFVRVVAVVGRLGMAPEVYCEPTEKPPPRP